MSRNVFIYLSPLFFYLLPANISKPFKNVAAPALASCSKAKAVSHNKRFRANIIVWGFSRDLSTLKIRAKLSDLGLSSFAAGKVAWEGDLG